MLEQSLRKIASKFFEKNCGIEFLEVSKVTDRELLWGAVIHGVFVISALLVALIGYIEKAAYKKKQEQA